MIIRWLGLVVGVVALIGVRMLQNKLFYDPLIEFFHSDFQGKNLPELNQTKYLIHIGLRYMLNVLISLGMIAWFFRNRQHVQLSSLVFGIVGIGLLVTLSILLGDTKNSDYMALFYTRRMLMHPMLLFVLFPALYFQDLKKQ